MFKWFSMVFQKLLAFVNFIYAYVSPIYGDVVSIIAVVKAKGLQDQEARDEVFKQITAVIKAKGIASKYSDSKINAILEVIYLLYKIGKA